MGCNRHRTRQKTDRFRKTAETTTATHSNKHLPNVPSQRPHDPPSHTSLPEKRQRHSQNQRPKRPETQELATSRGSKPLPRLHASKTTGKQKKPANENRQPCPRNWASRSHNQISKPQRPPGRNQK